MTMYGMKNSVTAIVMGAVVVMGTGCASTQSTNDTNTQTMTIETSSGAHEAQMRVDGLGCPMCAESISILMDNVQGVKDSRVDLSNGVVVVHLDPAVDIPGDALKRAIDDGGFTFRSIKFIR